MIITERCHDPGPETRRSESAAGPRGHVVAVSQDGDVRKQDATSGNWKIN